MARTPTASVSLRACRGVREIFRNASTINGVTKTARVFRGQHGRRRIHGTRRGGGGTGRIHTDRDAEASEGTLVLGSTDACLTDVIGSQRDRAEFGP